MRIGEEEESDIHMEHQDLFNKHEQKNEGPIPFKSFFSELGDQSKNVHNLFYEIRIFVMGLMMIISGTGLVQPDSNCKTITMLFFRFIHFMSFSTDSMLEMNKIHILVMLIILVVNVLSGIITLILLMQYKNQMTLNKYLSTTWIVMHRCIILFPSLIIGKYFGFYFNKLTYDQNLTSYVPTLALIFISLVAWLWSIGLSSYVYNFNVTSKRIYSDSSRLHRSNAFFEVFLTFYPLLNSMYIDVMKSFFGLANSYISFPIFNFIIFLICTIIIIKNTPFIVPSTNWRFIHLIFTTFLLSFLPIISNYLPNALGFSLILLLIFNPLFLFLSRIIFFKYNSSTETNQSDELCNFSRLPEDTDESPTNKYPLISITKQDITILIYLICGLIFMVYLNALTAQRMPETTALPDYLHEKFSIAKSLRESKYYGNYQISNIACIINGITLISFFFTARDSFNVRRIVIIYATLCYIRAVSFFLTTMPAPCTGTTKCPCSEHKALTDLKHANPFMIAFSWLFGLGMFLTHPQCGDLVISGHTMFLWLSTLGILDVIRIKIPTPFKQLMSASWVMFIMVSLLFIIISRNHYSIDVWFGFIFPQMFWMLYKAGQNSLKFKPGNNDSCLLELLRWIEYRKFQLIDDEEQNNEENVQIYEEPTM